MRADYSHVRPLPECLGSTYLLHACVADYRHSGSTSAPTLGQVTCMLLSAVVPQAGRVDTSGGGHAADTAGPGTAQEKAAQEKVHSLHERRC